MDAILGLLLVAALDPGAVEVRLAATQALGRVGSAPPAGGKR
ncbi:MAG TPA: hypothetical protein VMX54_14950 [Vicinamibacteria bacterium]|nr:hypothetical protein [Vicinamibacteria bacterium]